MPLREEYRLRVLRKYLGIFGRKRGKITGE
jgi:hypothetical protein